MMDYEQKTYVPVSRTLSSKIDDTVPAALKEVSNWLIWQYQADASGGKPKKVPMSVNSNGLLVSGSVTNAKVHMTFDDALKLYNFFPSLSGIGFVFTKDDCFTGLDFDQCISEEGVVEAWALTMLSELDTYSELSPSRRGFHCIVRTAGIASHRSKSKNFFDAKFEMYSQDRFFTFTGDVMFEYNQVQDRTELVRRYSDLIEKASNVDSKSFQRPAGSLFGTSSQTSGSLSDDEVLSTIQRLSNTNATAARFMALHEEGFDDGGDKSSLDIRYFNVLAFYTGKDQEQMERIYRQSAMIRPKSERQKYIEGTIAKAINGCFSVYNARGR